MFENYFSMESDNDEIDLDPAVTTNDETAVDEAGSDMEVTDVSGISEKTEEHNEEASAGGVSTGDNQDDLEMDPVAATEAFLFKRFHMSTEDRDELVQEIVNEEETNPIIHCEDCVDPDVSSGVVLDEAVGSGDAVVTDSENGVDTDTETTQATEGLNPAYGMEKAFGYFKSNDFKNASRDMRKWKQITGPKEFLNSELGKSKIKELKDDCKEKGMTPATLKECNELKSTFFNKWIRGNDETVGSILKYYQVDGVIFATWKCTKGLKEAFSCVGMFKTKKGKITSVGYALAVPVTKGVVLSDESMDPSLSYLLGWN